MQATHRAYWRAQEKNADVEANGALPCRFRDTHRQHRRAWPMGASMPVHSFTPPKRELLTARRMSAHMSAHTSNAQYACPCQAVVAPCTRSRPSRHAYHTAFHQCQLYQTGCSISAVADGSISAVADGSISAVADGSISAVADGLGLLRSYRCAP